MATEFTPLRGVRVVDVTSSFAGPYCTEILAALGADVIKVERPDRGDEARVWGPPFWEDGSALFFTANMSKRSLALDLKRSVDVLLRLVDTAQVFVQSLRPGAAERLGFGTETLRARNPGLVTCDLTAFGAAGPLYERPGYDPLVQAFSGLMSVTGEPERPGVRVGASVVDQSTGMWAAIGILAALSAGGGRSVDVSLFETASALLAYHATSYLRDGVVPGRHGSAFPLIAPYETFALAGGDVMIAAANDGLFRKLCASLGADSIADDSRFASNPDRIAHRAELAAMLAERLAGRSREDVLALLAEAGVPAAPVNDVGEAVDHEQTSALGLVQELPEPTLALPLSFDRERLLHRSPPPRLGEHSAAILREAGYTDGEIAELVAVGSVRLG